MVPPRRRAGVCIRSNPFGAIGRVAVTPPTVPRSAYRRASARSPAQIKCTLARKQRAWRHGDCGLECVKRGMQSDGQSVLGHANDGSRHLCFERLACPRPCNPVIYQAQVASPAIFLPPISHVTGAVDYASCHSATAVMCGCIAKE